MVHIPILMVSLNKKDHGLENRVTHVKQMLGLSNYSSVVVTLLLVTGPKDHKLPHKFTDGNLKSSTACIALTNPEFCLVT